MPYDAMLEPFKAQRRRDGVSETTIKRALEVVARRRASIASTI
jgi:hypothetical protein